MNHKNLSAKKRISNPICCHLYFRDSEKVRMKTRVRGKGILFINFQHNGGTVRGVLIYRELGMISRFTRSKLIPKGLPI